MITFRSRPHQPGSALSVRNSTSLSRMSSHSSSRLAGLKEYISQREIRLALSSRWAAVSGEEGHIPGGSTIQGWGKWASQKIRRNATDVPTIDEVYMFPSWASMLPRPDLENTFDVVLHVSGFAKSRRTPECLSRSQRAFLRLAKSFACIPKPQPLQPLDAELQDSLSRLHLPPRPDEISDDYDVESLDLYFRNSGNQNLEMDDIHLSPPLHQADPIPAEMARFHENLESRLKLFWASSLSSRRIQISVFAHPRPEPCAPHLQPILTREVLTGPDGYFSDSFNIDWNVICTHLDAYRTTSNKTSVEPELLVEAQVISAERMPELHETPTRTLRTQIMRSNIHIISDIDDTVKDSRVLDGARAIFNQVFVKDLEDTIVPGMGDWYETLHKQGLCFHYVSNSPFELLPVINQFISISKLPQGSIRLRSYAGRSLFDGLLSAPAARKRGNVLEVLDQFPESQFLLVGDSGEQDLELYSTLAAERPSQIVGVFIRNVSALGLEDPTGTRVDFGLTNSPVWPRQRGTTPLPPRSIPKRAASDTEVHPGAIRIPLPVKKGSLPSGRYSSESSPDLKPLSRLSEDSSSSVTSTGSSSVSSSSRSTRQAWPVTEGEKKRWDLQNRVNKARMMMPPHVVLRVFEDPKECVEAEQIIQRLADKN